ncbi:hypothetical protein Ntsu_79700 [Nocardia sp. IFM 10818]
MRCAGWSHCTKRVGAGRYHPNAPLARPLSVWIGAHATDPGEEGSLEPPEKNFLFGT